MKVLWVKWMSKESNIELMTGYIENKNFRPALTLYHPISCFT